MESEQAVTPARIRQRSVPPWAHEREKLFSGLLRRFYHFSLPLSSTNKFGMPKILQPVQSMVISHVGKCRESAKSQEQQLRDDADTHSYADLPDGENFEGTDLSAPDVF